MVENRVENGGRKWWRMVENRVEIDTKNGRKWWGMGESGLLNFWETGNWDRAVRKPPSPHTPIPTPLSTTSPHLSPTLIPASLPHSVIISFSFPYCDMENIQTSDASPISIVHSLVNFPTTLVSLLLSQSICFSIS